MSSDMETRDRLREAALSFDRGESSVDPLELLPSAKQGNEGTGDPDATRGEAGDTKQPDNPESSAEVKTEDRRKRGPDGKFLPKEEATSAEQTQTTDPEKPTDSAFKAKKAKEAERLDKTWKQVEAEKAEVRAERQRLADLAKDVEQLKQGAQQRQQSDSGLSSQEYAKAAHTFYQKGLQLVKDGDTEGAQEQFDYASRAQAEANKRAQDEQQQYQSHSLQERAGKWRSTAEAVIKEVPEYGDGTSEQSQQMQQLLKEHPLLGEHEHGFRYAHEILQLRRQAAEASGLREENTKLKAENERLNKLTAINGGKPNKQHSQGKSFAEMTIDEQRAHLRKDAALQDAA